MEVTSEPVTEEWLRSIGFIEVDGWNGIWLGKLRRMEHSQGYLKIFPKTPQFYWLIVDVSLDYPYGTRAEVLELLRALRIKTNQEI